MNGSGGYLSELELTSRAVVDAHDAHVHAATKNVRWERRGFLQRLTRGDRALAGDQQSVDRARDG
jgi:hypothetical protein